MLTVNQMASQQLPFMYMYQPGAIQEQLIQQAAQPVVSLPHQPMYGGLQHQHTSYQPHGIQNYAPFHMPPPTSQDSVAQHDRTPERNTQPQVQPQQQIQLPHQQQSGHFQQQQQQPSHMQWRNNNPQQTNRHKFQHHNMGNQAHRPTTWSTGTNQRQPHSNPNKQNRKPQSAKIRSDYYPQHYNNTAHAQSMAHNAAALNTSYYSPGEHHSKTLNTPENMYYMPYSAYSSGTTHHAGPRANNY